MKLYASMVVDGREGWGDSLPVLFFTEWLKRQQPAFEIHLWDGANAGRTTTYRDWCHRDHIERPEWIAGWLDGPPEIAEFDAVLATHHRHPIGKAPIPSAVTDREHGGWMPPGNYSGPIRALRMDCAAEWANLIGLERWRPSLPTVLAPPVFLPDKYVAIEFRRDDAKGRNRSAGVGYEDWARQLARRIDELHRLPIVSLGDDIGIGVDFGGFGLWQKIWTAAGAEMVYGHHGDLGAVCASYARRSALINGNPESYGRNPPIAVYGNVRAEVKTFTADGPGIAEWPSYEVEDI